MAIDAAGIGVTELRDRAERERADLREARHHQTATRRRQAAWARGRVQEAGMLLPAEARKLAENLYGIVDEACRPHPARGPVHKTAILAEADMRDGDGKSRMLYRYTLDPNLPEETRKQRSKQLTKHPGKYLKIADAAAQLAGFDADDVVCRLITGTRLAEGMDAVQDDFEPEYLDMLARAIQGQARRIMSEAKLDWYFQTIETHDLSPTQDAWTTDGDGSMSFHATVPAVELVTLELTEQVYRGIWSPRLPNGSDGPAETRTARPCLRVALTLAPLGVSKEIRAYFMRRHVLAVRGWADETIVGLTQSHLAEFNVEVVGWLGQHGRSGNIAGTFRLDGVELERFVAERGLIEFGMDDHEFLEVTPASIAEVLGSKLPNAPWVGDDALSQAAMHVTKSPPGTRIAVLEDVLHHGRARDDAATPLMALIEKDAQQRVVSLRSWWDGEQAKIEDVFSHMTSGDQL